MNMNYRKQWLQVIILAMMSVATQTQTQTQNDLVGFICSSEGPRNGSAFTNNRNAALAEVRGKLSEGNMFATGQSTISSEAVYGMAQCRNYLSQTECLACYDAAVFLIRTNCSSATHGSGAWAAFHGCVLRYENYDFYNRTTDNRQVCGSISGPSEDTEERKRLLIDLQVATPEIGGFFAASKRNTPNSTVYAVAQCALTITQNGCRGCLIMAYETLIACLPNTDGSVIGAASACFMRYSNASFFPHNYTTNINSVLQLPREINEKAVIGGSVGGAGLLVILLTMLIWYKFSRQLENARTGNILGATELQRPNRFNYKDLKEATNNFSEENKLGQGAFGVVYKARLRNESVVAVKRLDISNSRAKTEFESEVRLISNVQHRNLVRLLGYCSKGEEQLLVYEYMENKSLDRFLYGVNRGMLNWKQRTDIITGTAMGIAYLHEHYHITIIHRDIKPGNILLNNQFQAKIADFGLARLLPENQTHLSTKFAGTLGYAAPEYPIHGHLSEKVDIYSFGIVILEIISGRKCSDMDPDSTTEYLLREAWKLYERDMHENLVDKTLEASEYEVEELKRMVEIAMLCVQATPSSRPTMSQIIWMLSESEQRPARKPSLGYGNGFLDQNGLLSSEHSSSESYTTASQNLKKKPSC